MWQERDNWQIDCSWYVLPCEHIAAHACAGKKHRRRQEHEKLEKEKNRTEELNHSGWLA